MSALRHSWRDVPEVGTTLGLRTTIAVSKLLGRRVARALVSIVAFYYALFGVNARRNSREYLQKLGHRHDFWAVCAHLRCFAHTVLDRLFFVQDEFEPFEIHYHGEQHLRHLQAAGQGAILLGAHLGSFEVMRAQGGARDIPINVVGDFGNAQRINAVLQRINPNINTRLLQITPGRVDFALELGATLQRGELVAILGDRVGHGKSVRARFLGHEAEFPAGPYLLAATLRCPVYLTISIYTAPNRYDLYCEPFADEVALPRGARQEALAALVQRYADRLEHYCRLAPYNWFNFFPFWSLRDDPSPLRLTPALSPAPAPSAKLNETTIP